MSVATQSIHYVYLEPKQKLKKLPKTNIFTFDCETKDGLEGSQYFSGQLCTGKRVYFIKDETVLERFLLGRRTNFKCYVHNLGFDIRFIEQICLNNEDLEGNALKSGSQYLCYRILNKHGCKMEFVDSIPFFYFQSQKRLEKTFNVPLKYTKIDCSDLFDIHFDKWTENDKRRVIAHNKNDVIALHFIISSFRQLIFDLFGVDFKRYYSVASLGMDCFRTTLKEAILNPFVLFKNYGHVRQLYLKKDNYTYIRNAYRGGRNEHYANPYDIDEIVYYDDIHSFYPYVMFYQFFPTGKIYDVSFTGNLAEDIKIFSEINEMGIYHVKILKVPDLKIPYLHTVFDERLVFPKGNFSGYYSSIEIKKALKLGYEIEFISGKIFSEKAQIFKEYVEKLYDLKVNNDEDNEDNIGKIINAALYLIAKVLMNSLYGKFGQRVYREQTNYKVFEKFDDIYPFLEEMSNFDQTSSEFAEILKDCHIKNVNNSFVLSYKERSISVNFYNLPQLALFTTAYCRTFLYELMEYVGFDNFYYTDSDSLLMNKIAHDFIKQNKTKIIHLTFGKKLGNIETEWQGTNYVAFAPKCYYYEDLDGMVCIKAKGLHKEYRETLEKETQGLPRILRVAYVRDELMKGFRGIVRYMKSTSAVRNTGTYIAIKEIKKSFLLENKKRKWVSRYKSEPITVKC